MKRQFTPAAAPRGDRSYSRAKKLLADNRDAIIAYDASMLDKVLTVGILVSAIAFFLGFIRPDMHESQISYLLCALASVVILLVFHGERGRANPLVGLYLFFTLFYSLVLYLSCFVFRTRQAATALTFFCLVPMVFVDKPLRVDLYVFLLYIAHTVTAFLMKDAFFAGVDTVNCAISVFIGIAMGRVTLWDRLENFEANRQLKLERETDVLTTLFNRRKLFDEIAAIESDSSERPAAVLMMDIDDFKLFNDSYGHAAGDRCLHAFGTFLKNEHSDSAAYYRYGGEEFVGFLYGCGQEELADIAEHIRGSISKMDTEVGGITVSIGGVFCGDAGSKNYEYWIDRADKAAYAAKSKGRNTVEIDRAPG